MLTQWNCSHIKQLAAALPLVLECDQMANGYVRMATPFQYPNGEHIDIFWQRSSKGLIPDDYCLSDNGQTALYLDSAHVALSSTARKKELIGDILDRSGVTQNGVRFSIRFDADNKESVSLAIYKLARACMRIADLATHQRLRSSNPFRDDVEDFFDAHQFGVAIDVRLPAVFGKREIKMDFEVKNGSKRSYVNVLAAMNEAAAHSYANEIYVRLSDLRQSDEVVLQQLVTVYNSASSAIRPDDLERLSTISSVVSYPEQSDTLLEILQD